MDEVGRGMVGLTASYGGRIWGLRYEGRIEDDTLSSEAVATTWCTVSRRNSVRRRVRIVCAVFVRKLAAGWVAVLY